MPRAIVDKLVVSLSDGGVVADLVDVIDHLIAKAVGVVPDGLPQVHAVDVGQAGVVADCAQQRGEPTTSSTAVWV